jgi:chromosome segregation ATPase
MAQQRQIEGERHAQQLAQLQAELDAGNVRQAQQAELNATLKAELARLNEQLKSITSEREAAARSAQSANEQLASIHEQARQLGSQNQKLSDEAESLRSALGQLTAGRVSLQNNLIDAKDALLVAREELRQERAKTLELPPNPGA